MNINLKTVRVKYQTNDGTNMSYNPTLVVIKDINIPVCGCGNIPNIIQNANGTALYNYTGEDFAIKCECGITLKSEKTIVRVGISEELFNNNVISCIKKLVEGWSKAFCNNRIVKINFTTNK